MEFNLSKRGLHYVDVSVDETVQHMLVTTNDMLAEEDDNEEESGDFKPVEDERLIIEEMKDSNKEYVLVNTVCGNFEGYARHNIEKARAARKSQ